MGYYVNPKNESKESFLSREGELITTPQWPEDSTKVVVCLVDNGFFKAAGICFSRNELNAFTDPSDRRQRSYYLIDKSKLYVVSNITPDK